MYSDEQCTAHSYKLKSTMPATIGVSKESYSWKTNLYFVILNFQISAVSDSSMPDNTKNS